jgi:hypothetical protein
MKIVHMAIAMMLVVGTGWSVPVLAQVDKNGDGIADFPWDSDGDKIPDTCEVQMGLDHLDPTDAAGDMDGDGFTELQEYRAKTDITDVDSRPGAGKKDDRITCNKK